MTSSPPEWLQESSFGFASHGDDDFSFGASFSKIPERFRNLTSADVGWRVAERVRLANRWELHETPRKEPPSVVPVTLPEAILTVLAWPVAYLAANWLLKTIERLLALTADLGLVPPTGTLDADPTHACAAMASLVAAFVFWRRRVMRVGDARMLSGKIEH